MLPYADEPRPRAKRFPVVTIALLLLNIAVFLYQLSLGQDGAQQFVSRWGFAPGDFWSGQHLETLLTAMFLHGGLLHIAGNMLFLWIFGDNVEDQLGHITYLIVYLLAGIVASLSFAVVFPDTGEPLVGASGAIAGVLGGYLLLFPRAMVRALLFFAPFFTIGRVAAVILIGFWFLIQVVSSVQSILQVAPQSNVAYIAHVGGFIVGLIATGIIREARDQAFWRWEGRRWWSRSFRNFALLVAGVVGLFLLSQLLFNGGEQLWANILRLGIAGVVVAVALLDGLARLRGQRALLGSTPQTNKVVALIQIASAVSLVGAVIVG